MRFRKLIATLAMISATAGVSALASSAQAAVVDNDALALLSDSEVTLTDGNVAFDWTQGTVTPRLTGKLNVVHGRRACYRVNIESYDLSNTRLHSTHGGDECPADAKAHTYTVDLSGASDPLMTRVTVAV